jgi:hypothetical protein
MSKMSEEDYQQLTLFQEDSPAKIYPLLESVRDWLENEADSGGSSYESFKNLNLAGLLSKTSLVCFPATQETSRHLTCKRAKSGRLTRKVTWPSSFRGFRNAGIGGPTGFSTFSFTEFPKDGAVSSLSEVLESDAPKKYFLSPKAARGILRRAEKRGKELPLMLREALEQVAKDTGEKG